MSIMRFFLVTLVLVLWASFYWVYFLSDTWNFFWDIKIWQDLKQHEDELFKQYNLDKLTEIQTFTWANETTSIEESEVLKVLRTVPNKDDAPIETDSDIKITFSNIVNIENLLWFITIDWTLNQCPESHETLSIWTLYRCLSLNKIFLYQVWQTKEPFKWKIKKSQVNDTTLVITPDKPLLWLSNYILEISAWVEWISKTSSRKIYSISSTIVEFSTWEPIKKYIESQANTGWISTWSSLSWSISQINAISDQVRNAINEDLKKQTGIETWIGAETWANLPTQNDIIWSNSSWDTLTWATEDTWTDIWTWAIQGTWITLWTWAIQGTWIDLWTWLDLSKIMDLPGIQSTSIK